MEHMKQIDLPINYHDSHWTVRKEARLQYIKEQDGFCHHCGSLLSEPVPPQIAKYKINKRIFPKGMFDNPIHLHHDRKTGLSIGAVHAECNAILWEYYGL